jgi:signal transduction histidine kinase/ActR/RegA family two-component response regulator
MDRETVIWPVLQTRIEVKEFIDALLRAAADGSAARLDEVRLRYDVLYSRADFLRQGLFAASIREFPALDAAALVMHDAVTGLAPVVDDTAGDPAALRAALPALLAGARQIDHDAAALATTAKATSNAAVLADRAMVSALYSRLAISVAALVGVIGLVVVAQAHQLRQLAHARQELETLNDLNVGAAKAAEAGTRAKSAFLAAMSHEIRTPLNGIMGMAELVATGSLSPEQSAQLALIRQSGAHLLEIVNDVLDFSKVESGCVSIELADFPLRELVEMVGAVVAPRVEQKGLTLDLDVPDVIMRNDPTRLRQVLVNLAANAAKFTESGGIRISAAPRGDGLVRFEVEDTGIGIAETALPMLFREFSQVENGMTRRYDGTGLGLAICKRLVEAMGGAIGVHSVPGLGSRFWLEIPGGDLRPRPAAEPAPRHEEQPPRRFAGHVLVVEDNPTNQIVTCAMLRRLGLSCEVAENGRVALDRLDADARFDLALLDMQMPVLDGLSTAREIRARGLALPLVGLSADVMVSDRQACLDAGMNDFVAKPASLERIADALAPWLAPAAPDRRELPGAAA